MRSRYVGYVIGDSEYLRATWHSSTRPDELTLDPATEWRGLEIIATTAGGMFDNEGTVEFIARHRDGGRMRELHERSRFAREEGEWRYLDGVVAR